MVEKKLSIEEIKAIPKPKLRKMIDDLREKIKAHPVVKNIFKEYGLDESEIDLIPMAFADLEVSARTDHGIIYLNYKLLQDGSILNNDHYLIHEITHFVQQSSGDKPTQGSDDGNYLDNKFEQEGFQNQTEYISDTRGDEVAEAYIDKVLDHHDIKGLERKKRKQQLLQLASKAK